MDDRHALFDVEADARDKSQHIAGYKQLVDLATGQVIREAVLQEDGRYASFSVMQYKLVQDYPVLASEQNYTFGPLSDGQWGVKNITITNRENLQVGYRAES